MNFIKDIILPNFNPQFAITKIFTPRRNSNSLRNVLQRPTVAVANGANCKHTAQQILLQVAASARAGDGQHSKGAQQQAAQVI